MKINNYRFQQQQKAKQQHKKIKKIKEKGKKIPLNATEEIDYIKKLLNGEEVEDFKHEEVSVANLQNGGRLNFTEQHWLSEKNSWIAYIEHLRHKGNE